MAGALRNTAFYASLANASGSSQSLCHLLVSSARTHPSLLSATDHPPSLYLEPLQSQSSATLPLLAALHPTLSQSELELLYADYEVENRRLEQAVRQDGLEQYAKEIVRLLRTDEADGSNAQAGDEVVMVE